MPHPVLSLVLLVNSQTISAERDFQKAIELWTEFGKPTSVLDEYGIARWNRFQIPATFQKALEIGEKGKVSAAIEFLEKDKSWVYDKEDSAPTGWAGRRANKSYEAHAAWLVYRHLINDYLDGASVDQLLPKLEKLHRKRLIVTSFNSVMGGGRGLNTFIADLRRIKAIKPANPGTAQAAVNSLVDVSLPNIDFIRRGQMIEDPVFKALMEFNLDAVEPLLGVYESKLLTRTFISHQMLRPESIATVSVMAKELVRTIANGDLGGKGDFYASADEVRQWLKAKKADRVESWLLTDLTTIGYKGRRYCNRLKFSVISAKYPYLLKSAYESVLSSKADPHLALSYLESAKISREEKRELYEMTLAVNFRDASSALYHVRGHDQNVYDRALLRFLPLMTGKFDLDYAYFPCYMNATDHPELWRLLDRKIIEADLPFKMCLIKALARGFYTQEPDSRRTLAVRLLGQYFESKDTLPPGIKFANLARFDLKEKGEPMTLGQIAILAAAQIDDKGIAVQRTMSPEKWIALKNALMNKYKLSYVSRATR